jgi:hypothetical protein
MGPRLGGPGTNLIRCKVIAVQDHPLGDGFRGLSAHESRATNDECGAECPVRSHRVNTNQHPLTLR